MRKTILAAAAVAGLAALAVPFVHGVGSHEAADARSGVALLLSIAFSLGLSVGLGASTIASAIVSRRIAFDFARPLSSLAIWSGRLVGAILLAAGSAAIVLLPTVVSGGRVALGDLLVDANLESLWPLLAVIALLAAFASSQAASTMLQARSGLLALDAVLTAAAVLGGVAVLSWLPASLAPAPHARVGWGLGLGCVAGLLAAGFAATACGRTDIRAAHRATSLTLWTCVAAVLAAAAAYAAWVRSAAPSDLAGFWVGPASTGPWAALEGHARGARMQFLFDTAGGRFERLLTAGEDGPAISLDGRRAAWVDGADGRSPLEIVALALDVKPLAPVRTGLLLPHRPSLFVLSPDGSRVATILEGTLSIHDLTSGRTLAAARIPNADARSRGFFVGPSRFRSYTLTEAAGAETTLEVSELDAETRALRVLGRRELPGDGAYLAAADRAGERLIVVEWSGRRTLLLDARTGGEIAELAASDTSVSRSVRFLADGRIVLSDSSPSGTAIRVFDARGRSERVVVRLDDLRAILGGEVTPGHLAVRLGDKNWSKWSTSIVDVNRGVVRPLENWLMPAMPAYESELNGTPEPGSEATRLFVRNLSELVRLDPDTGQLRVVLHSEAHWHLAPGENGP